jgi:hypothetical protein
MDLIRAIAARLKRRRSPPLVPHGPRPRRFFAICHRCGEPESLPGITEETVGNWGDRFTCRRCLILYGAGPSRGNTGCRSSTESTGAGQSP